MSENPSLRHGGPCEVPGCPKISVKMGLCGTHYHRQSTYGNLHEVRGLNNTPFEERLWIQTDKDGPVPEHAPELGQCWIWTGTINNKGYGAIKRDDKVVGAHRAAYELLVGPIPKGLDLDHLCRNPPCINPSHMEPVTHRENVMRGVGACALNARKTECKHGHSFNDPKNLGINAWGRFCRECQRQRYHEKKLQDAVSSAMIVDTYSGEE